MPANKHRLKYLLLCIILIATSCRPSEPVPDPVDRFIPQELKDYIEFKPGTWWLYRDSLKGTLDTMRVTSHSNYYYEGKLSYNQAPCHCEYLGVKMTFDYDQADYSYGVSTAWASKTDINKNLVTIGKHNVTMSFGTHIYMAYPFTIGNQGFTSYGNEYDLAKIENRYDTLYGYSDVVEVSNSLNKFEFYRPTRSYFARHIGLIRYEVPDSNKYKILETYNIVQ